MYLFALLALLHSVSQVTVPPPVQTANLVTLPTGQTTVGEIEAAFAKAKQQLNLAGNWPRDTTVMLPTQAQPQFYISALDVLARTTQARILVDAEGNLLRLVHAPVLAPSSVSGDFRVVVSEVTARLNPATGERVCEVTLLWHWDPSLCVIRMDGEPTLTKIALDQGMATHQATKTKTAVNGSRLMMMLRLPNVPREAKSISLAGSVTVTAANFQSMVFETLPTTEAITKAGSMDAEVKAALHPVKKLKDRLEFKVDVVSPQTAIVFESFESGLRYSRNRFTLIGPDATPQTPMNDDLRETSATTATLTYRFPVGKISELLAGSKAVVLTPTRFHEFAVNFELNSVMLP